MANKFTIGVPKEIKTDEYRVAMIPVGVEELTRAGHQVLIQAGAGQGSGISDEQYAAQGAEIVADAAAIWKRADLIVKVKEPLPDEWPLMRPGQIVFTYFHFAADEALTDAVMESGITAIAYETIRDAQRQPAAADADERGGRAHEHPGGGEVPGAAVRGPRHSAGRRAGRAAGQRRRSSAAASSAPTPPRSPPASAPTSPSSTSTSTACATSTTSCRATSPRSSATGTTSATALSRADLVIGAVLIPGAQAPHLVRRDDLKRMQPRAVIVDVAIDQGGCVETSRPTTHSEPTYIVDDVVHYCVTNMPGAVGRTSTYALTNVTLPYVAGTGEQGLRPGRQGEPGPGSWRQHPPGQGHQPRGGGDLPAAVCGGGVAAAPFLPLPLLGPVSAAPHGSIHRQGHSAMR